MVNVVIKFYDRKLSAYNLIFKHMKFTYYMFIFSGTLLIFNLFPVIFMKYLILKITLCIFIALFIIFFVLLNIQAKKIIKSKFLIDQRNFIWGGEDLYNKRVSMLKEFLDQSGINSMKKIEELLKLLNKEADNRKFTWIIIPGTFLAFTVPLWNHILGLFLKNLDDFNIVLAYGIVLTFFVLLFVVVYSMLKSVLSEIVDRPSKKIKEIEGLVENIYFNYVLGDESNK